MVTALRRFFRRFNPRILHITVVDQQTGNVLLNIDEKTCSMLASLEGNPGLFERKFASTRPITLMVRMS